jgi:hypothetical protein
MEEEISRMMKNICFLTALAACGFCATLTAQNSSQDSLSSRLLNEIVVSASQLQDNAPVSMQTIQSKEITEYLGLKTYPETMRMTAGVYATAESGSYGDAKLNIRGFKQENFTIMLNGVPLSGFRSGSMFWNNWLGLTDATYRIQIQKGVGGSMLAANSMGGTVNILTKPADATIGRSLTYSISDYGLNNLRLSYNSGELRNGWAVSFIGSRTWGEGYVDATAVNSWGYFLNVRKRLNTQHSLLFTFLGAPDRHGQRSQKLSAEEVETYGLKYNKNWGMYRGKINNISENFYHKPYIAATHFFTISDKALLSNTLYFSIGDGGGRWTENAGGTAIAKTLDAYGQIDWGAVASANQANGQSLNIQSDYLAGHTWTGLKSTFDYTLNEQWKIASGLHYQAFYSWQNERITDLLGGNYWVDKNEQKTVGDYIRLHNGDRDNHLSLYSQAEYTTNRVRAFAGALLSATVYQHWDKYNYTADHYYSDRVWATGGNLKAGASWNFTDRQHLYLNGGWYSRAPYSSVYFASNNNEITKNVRNERNYIAETGYKYVAAKTKWNINIYYNYWKNKSLTSDPYKQEDERPYLITGLDARHAGVEISLDQIISNSLSLNVFASIGHWQWQNDVNTILYDSYSYLPTDTIQIFTDGLMVGDAPQTQIGATADFKLFDCLSIRVEARYNDRLYADFKPEKRTDPTDRSQSYRIPASFVSDLHIQYPLQIRGVATDLFLSCSNLFNAHFIERGDDGATHDLASFRGFWGAGRTLQTGLRVKF